MANDNNENKIPKSITDKLDLLDKKIGDIYSDIYVSNDSDSSSLEKSLDRLDIALDKLQDNDVSIDGMTRLLQSIDKNNGVGNNNNVNQLMNSVQDLFSDQNIVNNIFATEEVHKYISAQNYQYDLICKYLPRLLDALEIKRDNVLSSDSFSKDFVNPLSRKFSKQDTEIFAVNTNKIENEYNFTEFLDKTYMNCSKYGEDFIYIVPYKVAFERLVKRSRNRQLQPTLGTYSFFENTSYSDSDIIVESGFDKTKEYIDYKAHINEEFGDISVDNNSFNGSVNIHYNDTGMINESINEILVLKNRKSMDRFKSLGMIHEDNITFKNNKFEDTIARNDGITQSFNNIGNNDGLVLNNILNIDPEKIDNDIRGAVLERLPRENVIPIYIGNKCIGYYYLEFAEDKTACGFCGGHHTTPRIGNAGLNNTEMAQDQQELAIRFIASKISANIDTKFINANKDLKDEIYNVLRYNEKFDIERSNDIGVTFIPADDIVHCYFELDEDTHRGISDLQRALIPAMMYILLYLTDIIGKITRSTDKRLYYVKQNVEQNIARTMMNTIYNIKKGNLGMRQIESMNSILNIVGQYNDHIIPVGPSGDPPIQFEVMQGQDIQTPTDLMEKMEESAINTIMPFEMVNATYSQDFATRFSMSNTRFLKDIYTRQRKVERFASIMYTKIYNYEFDENNPLIEIQLPPPTYLTMTNNAQIIDNVTQLIDKQIELEIPDKPDEEKNEFKKLMTRYYLNSYFDFDLIDKYIDLAKVNVNANKKPAAEDGQEDMGEYM